MINFKFSLRKIEETREEKNKLSINTYFSLIENPLKEI